MDDAAHLIEEAHRRGMRIIADMVMNHTSDQHPWFQECRQRGQPQGRLVRLERRRPAGGPRPGSSSSTPRRRTGAGTPAKAVLLAPVLHHQPDLNYDNPEVAEAMLDVVRFWLDLGLDGFRLDAVPYLFERDGTNGENLPETHEYLRRVRARSTTCSPARCSWPRPTSGRPTSSTTSATATSATCASTSPHAPHVHGGAAGAAPADHRDPRADAGDPRRLPSGASSSGTTTS